MAYEFKSTVYFPDEKSHDSFVEKAKSSNKTKSKYILGLIQKERALSDMPPVHNDILTVLPPYYKVQPIDMSSGFEFTLPLKDKYLLRKKIMDEIDTNIMNVFSTDISSKININQEKNSLFVIIKIKLDIIYSITSTPEKPENCLVKVSYFGIFGSLNCSEEMWREFNGTYDFTKIKYLKYQDVFFPPIKNKFPNKKILAPLIEFERTSDISGGFFIPVSKTEKNYPIKLDKFGFTSFPFNIYIKLIGPNMYANQSRISFTKMNKVGDGVRIVKKFRV
ncbi:hypothetical protein [Budvicia aquatica]|uniref:Uncharacterized protein n=1 Tax=Budvicia aquatica TaxID=82979 RepID=A0A2C6DSR8_9GAMM|nr:hypothetical protein [Budvicia aquatica]PHI32257.1 hypothetical protein CRN84_24520 [Budvicia aquatica]VFS45173.1 Uncharacterised protein [Budvicia aquatica]